MKMSLSFLLNQRASVTVEFVDKIILMNGIGNRCFSDARSAGYDGLVTDRYGPARSILRFGIPR